jgi:hypothetical protein
LPNYQIIKLPNCSVWFSYPQKRYYLVNLFTAHLLRHGMIAGVDSDEGGGVIVINLDLGEIGNAILSLCKDAMALGTMHLIQHLSLVGLLYQQGAVVRRNVIGNVVRKFLLAVTLLEDHNAE